MFFLFFNVLVKTYCESYIFILCSPTQFNFCLTACVDQIWLECLTFILKLDFASGGLQADGDGAALRVVGSTVLVACGITTPIPYAVRGTRRESRSHAGLLLPRLLTARRSRWAGHRSTSRSVRQHSLVSQPTLTSDVIIKTSP